MKYPSELSSEYDQYGFDRADLLKFFSSKGINLQNEAIGKSDSIAEKSIPEWAKSLKANKRFSLYEAADILIGIDPWHEGWRGDDGEREFNRTCTTLKQAVEDGDLLPVSADNRDSQMFHAQDLRAWAASVGFDWCIPFDAPAPAISNTTAAVSDDAVMTRLRQIEAENARLVEQVAELERRLAEATASVQQAPQPEANAPGQRWPWGDHHTEALGHLEAAGLRFWQWFDPTEPATAETNENVVDWLITERKASKDRARAIASLLRADGLPHGPRR